MYTNWSILKPIKIGNSISKNRIIMGAHSYGYATKEGLPTNELDYYLEERAKGGLGIVIMGGTAVSKIGSFSGGHPTQNINNKIIKPYKRISNKIHQYGVLVFDQLLHVGGQLRNSTGIRIVGPSPVHHERTRGTPLELSTEEIYGIIKDYTLAALRARDGGLDGVEIKCDQGLLLHQFMSPYYNHRKDEYGYAQGNGIKIVLDILESIRKAIARDIVVGVKITGGSSSIRDISYDKAKTIAKNLADSGLLDYLHINGATNSTYRGYLYNHGDSSIKEANFSNLSKDIKEIVDIPVILSSMISSPETAEFLVENNYTDMVAMTRAHIADPEIIKKVQEGELEDIRPCIRCNQECVGGHHLGNPVRCIHNPATGREKELGVGTLRKVSSPKKVLIVGGGIAGLETARVAALRGFDVHLLEKQKKLGGQILVASKLPYMQGLRDISHYLEKQIMKLRVNVYLDNEVTSDKLSLFAEDMDAIVISTGSRPEIPPIYSNIEPENSLTPTDMLVDNVVIKKNILVVDVNWRQNPLAIAEWLLQRGCKVTVISSEYYVGEGINIANRASHYIRIQNSATLLPLTELVSHRDNVATVRNVLDNKLREIQPIDQVVFACGFLPNNPFRELKNTNLPKMYFVGDCVSPIGITDAILQANRLARIL